MANVEFFDLPREVRDMVYLYFRGYSWIDITQMPDRIHQPSISKVSRKVRKECLDVFYGKNRFMLDMRGWKHSAYPINWTPNHIFEHWIAAIGDVNAARLRNVSFYVHNFAVHFTISHLEPRISAKFRQTRTNTSYIDLAEEAPASYSFQLAIQRARARIERVVTEMTKEVGDEPLTVKNIRGLCDIVESIKPALCTRMGIGWKGAIFPEDPFYGPHVERHRKGPGERYYWETLSAQRKTAQIAQAAQDAHRAKQEAIVAQRNASTRWKIRCAVMKVFRVAKNVMMGLRGIFQTNKKA